MASAWTWAQRGPGSSSEQGTWNNFAVAKRAGNPVLMLSTDSWQQLLSGMPSDAQLSLDWFRRSVEFGVCSTR